MNDKYDKERGTFFHRQCRRKNPHWWISQLVYDIEGQGYSITSYNVITQDKQLAGYFV